MGFTQDFLKRMKKAITPKKTLSWVEKNAILKEYPDYTVKSLSKITKIQVGTDECVSCFTSNSFSGLLRTGTHDLSDNIDKVVFINASVQKEKFGIRAPNYPITADKKSFGFSGTMSFKILEENAAIANFLSRIVQSKPDYTSKDVVRWLRDGPVFTAFKEILGAQTYDEFYKTPKIDLIIELESRIGYELMDYGIELVSLEIMNYTDPVQF